MAKEKQEKQEEQVEEKNVESTVKDDKIRIKKPSFKKNTDEVRKVDLREFNKTEEEVITKEEEKQNEQPVSQEQPVVEDTTAEDSTSEENKEQVPKDEQSSVLEEITSEEVEDKTEELTEEVEEAVKEQQQTGEDLPENIQKVVDFMKETGGSLEDYVKLNQDFSSLDDNYLLLEYYKQTKPHLSRDEIDFLIEDTFDFDEDVDEERDIKRKKLAFKEQVANARGHLDGQKSKYYEEIKAGSKLTPEQQKAMDFFSRYNKESESNGKVAERQKLTFKNKTNEVFSDQFKGFEYKVGEKRYRFNVKDADKIKDTQSDINNFIGKFLNKNNEMSDAKGYHKSLFTAMNPDAIANHFYEQGKADAIKNTVAKSKNIDMDPRQGHEGFINDGQVKARILRDDTSPTFKFKLKK